MWSNPISRAFPLFLALFFFSSARLAAQDASSVADAARQAREQKQASSKPAHVVDNDSLPPSPVTAPAAAKDSAPTTAQAAATENGSNAPAADGTAANSQDVAEKKAKIDALKQEIADQQQSVNLHKRELALAQDSYYSNPDHDRDKPGKEKLDSLQSDLSQQQAQLAELQAKLAELAPPADNKTPEPAKP
jgi:predicted RNase H-like nuclease (RuvC/YqgF family)